MAFIDAHQTRKSGGLRWGVEPICRTLQIAPSTYYDAKGRPPSARALRDAELGPKLKVLWVRNYSVYGRRKLTVAALSGETPASTSSAAVSIPAGVSAWELPV